MEFSKLGKIRSLIQSHVHMMMTLTATATKETTKKVIAILDMQHPVIVSATSDKPNVSSWVKEAPKNMEEPRSCIAAENTCACILLVGENFHMHSYHL